MIIGIDLSLTTCVDEGYMQMRYDGRKKFNPTTQYDVFQTYPDYIREEQNLSKDTLILDTCCSLEDLLELYIRHKDGVDSMTCSSHSLDPLTYDYDQFLFLADELDSYCGIA